MTTTNREYVLAKSPESETTTVPVALRRSREVGMVVVDDGVGEPKFFT